MDHKRYSITKQGSSLWRSLRDGDFEEEEVWEVLRDRRDSNSSRIGKPIEPSISLTRNHPSSSSSARMIPRTGSTSNNFSHETRVVQQQSAPVNIPDWSKICRRNKKKPEKDDLEDDNSEEEEEEGGDDCYKIPPHEFISRRLARSQISSFSVFEGVGRKLKGRDLSKVRNAVLTRTGFLESP